MNAKVDEKDEAVQIEDEATVTIEVEGEAAAEAAEKEAETEPKKVAVAEEEEPKPKKIERVRLSPDKAEEADDTAALTASLKKAQDERAAALATAESERRQREEADRRAATAEADQKTAREAAESSQLTLLTNSIESAERELASQEAELTRAMEAGDFAKVSAAQVKVSRLAAKVDRLTVQKEEAEANPKPAPTLEGRVEAAAPSAFERYLAQGNFAPAAQAWLRAHPNAAPDWAGGDPQTNAKMMAGHYKAVGQNIKPNTPEYFQVIEESAGFRAAPEVEEDPDPAPKVEKKPAPKRAAQPAAPVSRDPPTAQGLSRGTRTITLTPAEQESALISFPHLTKKEAFATYAKNKIELEAEGKMGRLTH